MHVSLYRLWKNYVLGKALHEYDETQIESWFWVFSPILVLSLYFYCVSSITFCLPPPGPTAAPVALTMRAPKVPRRAAPGPTAAAVALTVRAPQAPRRAAPGLMAAMVAFTVRARAPGPSGHSQTVSESFTSQ